MAIHAEKQSYQHTQLLVSKSDVRKFRTIRKVDPIDLPKIVQNHQINKVAIDLGRETNQVYFIDELHHEEFNFKCKTEALEIFLNLLQPRTVVCMESCAGSQRIGRICARKFATSSAPVSTDDPSYDALIPHLINPVFVRGVRGSEDKSDAADARAIYKADMLINNSDSEHFVNIKTEKEQGGQLLVKYIEELKVSKTEKFNRLLSVANEFAFVRCGNEKNAINIVKEMILSDASVNNYVDDFAMDYVRDELDKQENTGRRAKSNLSFESIYQQGRQIAFNTLLDKPLNEAYTIFTNDKCFALFLHLQDFIKISKQVKDAGEVIEEDVRTDEFATRLCEIPGVGVVTAWSLSKFIKPIIPFVSTPAELVKYVGLAPKHTGTGGKTRILGVQKGGLSILKKYLFQCGLSTFLRHCKIAKNSEVNVTSWVLQLREKNKTPKVIAVAIASKIIRKVHALWHSGEDYCEQKDCHLSIKYDPIPYAEFDLV